MGVKQMATVAEFLITSTKAVLAKDAKEAAERHFDPMPDLSLKLTKKHTEICQVITPLIEHTTEKNNLNVLALIIMRIIPRFERDPLGAQNELSRELEHSLDEMTRQPLVFAICNKEYPMTQWRQHRAEIKRMARIQFLNNQNIREFSAASCGMLTLYSHYQTQINSAQISTAALKADLEHIILELRDQKEDKTNLTKLLSLLTKQDIPITIPFSKVGNEQYFKPDLSAHDKIRVNLCEILMDIINEHLSGDSMTGFGVQILLAEIDAVIKEQFNSETKPTVLGIDTFMMSWIQKLWGEHMPQLGPNSDNVKTGVNLR